ncbi:unnamed protein product [Didymodactylos carnosus]|uniref:Uncharacterized protein n=1 Tax=Didymodactylos carnosus TaxID=1234261 RepID=A0A8S2XFX0_9BILA|nr:unnamed protein product [Didymodactylos carnosus]
MKECGTEIDRIRDNNAYKAKSPRHATTNDQNFYKYFTLYGNSLTTKDLKDNQLQIVLPSSSTLDSTEKLKPEKAAKQSTKAKTIVKDNIKRQANEKIQEEHEPMLRITNMLKTIPKNNYFDLIKVTDSSLQLSSSCIQTSTNRLNEKKKTTASTVKKYILNLNVYFNDAK